MGRGEVCDAETKAAEAQPRGGIEGTGRGEVCDAVDEAVEALPRGGVEGTAAASGGGRAQAPRAGTSGDEVIFVYQSILGDI